MSNFYAVGIVLVTFIMLSFLIQLFLSRIDSSQSRDAREILVGGVVVKFGLALISCLLGAILG